MSDERATSQVVSDVLMVLVAVIAGLLLIVLVLTLAWDSLTVARQALDWLIGA